LSEFIFYLLSRSSTILFVLSVSLPNSQSLISDLSSLISLISFDPPALPLAVGLTRNRQLPLLLTRDIYCYHGL